MRRAFFAPAATALALGLALTGCTAPAPSGDATPTTATATTTATPNATDAMFVMMMVPHHRQAIEMSDLVLAKPDVDPRVHDLAQRIKDAQQPEIEQMEAWLDEWGFGPGNGPMPSHDMGHGHGGMDGMLSEEEMAALEAATGPEASRAFLEGMITHHEGAIEMAQPVVDRGAHPGVVALAEHVITSQTAEIEEMRGLLASL